MSLLIRWHAPSLQGAVEQFRAHGFRVEFPADGAHVSVARVLLSGAALELAADHGRRGGRLEVGEVVDVAEATEGPEERAAEPLPRLVAIGWATVDIDRVVAASGEATLELGADRLLGARAVLLGDGPIVLLEPDTEARIASTLARHGEGPVAIYVADLPGVAEIGRVAAGTPVAAGPFGRSVLLAPAPLHGPHLVLCDGRRAVSTTIAR